MNKLDRVLNSTNAINKATKSKQITEMHNT